MKNLNKKIIFLLLLMLPAFLFGEENDAFILPFKEMIQAWMQGDVGLTVAIVIMVISVLWGAAGGGFPIIGKGFLLSIIVGGVIYFAEKAFEIGKAFTVASNEIQSLTVLIS